MRAPSVMALAALLASCGGGEPVQTTADPEPSVGGEDTPPAAAPLREPLGQVRLVARPTTTPVVTIRVVFDAGSAEDPSGLEGVTRLAAELMTQGGAGELSYREITARLFPMAAVIGSGTDRDQTVIVGRVHRDHLDAFYAIFRSVLLEPRMEQADFERVLAQARSALELELRGNDDEELGKQTLQAMLYEGHPYGHPALGTERGLAAIDLPAVRAQRRRVLCGARATVGVTGAYPDGFAERVRDDVARLDGEGCVGRLRLPAVAAREPRVWLVDKPEAGAVAISMGAPIDVVRGDDDYAAMVLAAAWLGQHRTFAGRLMSAMRGQRGLNYGDYAYAEHFDQEGWSTFPLPNIARRQQYFSIWVRPVAPEQAHFALRMAVRELRRFVEVGLSEEDFTRIQRFVDGYYALYLQTESRQLGYAIDDVFYAQERAWIDRLREQWRSLTREQVNAAIRRHVRPERLEIAVVGPGASAFADRLAGEAPSPIEYRAEPSPEVLAEDREIVGHRVGIARERMTVVPLAQIFR